MNKISVDAPGVDGFTGEIIHFGEGAFTAWNAVVEYLIESGLFQSSI